MVSVQRTRRSKRLGSPDLANGLKLARYPWLWAMDRRQTRTEFSQHPGLIAAPATPLVGPSPLRISTSPPRYLSRVVWAVVFSHRAWALVCLEGDVRLDQERHLAAWVQKSCQFIDSLGNVIQSGGCWRTPLPSSGCSPLHSSKCRGRALRKGVLGVAASWVAVTKLCAMLQAQASHLSHYPAKSGVVKDALLLAAAQRDRNASHSHLLLESGRLIPPDRWCAWLAQ